MQTSVVTLKLLMYGGEQGNIMLILQDQSQEVEKKMGHSCKSIHSVLVLTLLLMFSSCLKIFCIPLWRKKNESTNSSGLYKAQTATLWMSNVQVNSYPDFNG